MHDSAAENFLSLTAVQLLQRTFDASHFFDAKNFGLIFSGCINQRETMFLVM
jgi:hypothetical protein